MLFNSGQFLCFFPLVIILYYVIPGKFRYIWLLVSSYYFYIQYNFKYAFLLLFTTVITYAGAILLDEIKNIKKRRIVLHVVIITELALLAYFKYFSMLAGYINKILSFIYGKDTINIPSVVLPVGISFFTLQSMGYLIDVYRKDIYSERNFFRYALFVSFFPQLVAGPIERSKNLLKQLATSHKFNFENLRHGALIMTYGFFVKTVIADRLAIFVDAVYKDPGTYDGIFIVIATVLFALQIYCDFYGYSTIAKGASMTMGIKLMDNFNAPYYSKSVKEFWRRWHISLSTWFRDYLYIPLGGNRKGQLRKYINLIIVFAISGLWHGASVAFIVWGLLHGLYQILEYVVAAVVNKLKLDCNITQPKIVQVIKILLTFALCCFAWLFFRAGSISASKQLLLEMINNFSLNHFRERSMFGLGVSKEYFCVLALAIIVLAIVDYYKYHYDNVTKLFFGKKWFVRVSLEILMIVAILLFGCYGELYDVHQFIYFQF